MKLDDSRKIWIGAGAVFVISQIIYILGLHPTCPFWDSGEFIATTYTLGIPHPPGNPFYMLLGRIWTMLPIGSIAVRVNYLSAFAASLAAVAGYLVTVEFFRWQQRGRTDRLPLEMGVLGGVTAGLFTAFSRTFWMNAVEAEMYAIASLVVMLALWLVIRWAGDEGATERKNGLFVLAYYIVAVAAGIYLGTFLIVPALLVFVLLVDHRVLAPSVPGALAVAAILIGLNPAMLPNLHVVWVVLLILGLLGSLLLGRYWSPLGPRGVVFWCLLLAVVGLMNHLYLPIRAHLHPMINEADPQTPHQLWLALIRDQYKPVNPFTQRNASWGIQFGKHFWRYARDQYQVFNPAWLGCYLPYAVGLIGMIQNAKRDKRTFLTLLAFYLMNTIGLIFYLNFRDDEVRDRDYFFTMGFQAFAIWIGLGFTTLAGWVRWAYSDARDRLGGYLGYGVAFLGIVLAFSACHHFYKIRDRHGFYLARDLAYNMLAPLDPNALLFTNGDNDTFPLWYIQEVEHFRQDVRILNLSLLNTDWYIRQLRDYKPQVDLGWTDQDIDAVKTVPDMYVQYAQQDIRRDQYVSFLKSNGLLKYIPKVDEFTYAKDIASRRIIEREYGEKPIYFAVTVPDQMGFTNRLTMEGLTFRLGERHPGDQDEVDVDKTLHNLRDVYMYRGLLKADGTYDASVYKDDNAQKLVQNYAAGYIRVAERLIELKRTDEAMQAAKSALALSDAETVIYSLGVLYYKAERFDSAEASFRQLVRRGYGDFAVMRLLGRSIERQGRLAEAEQVYRDALAANPDEQEALREIFSFYIEQGRKKDAADILRRWLARHPADEAAKKRLTQLQDSL